MILRTFRGEKSKYEPECRQLLEICSILRNHPSDEEIFLATNFRIASGEVDCLILKNNGPILLELKAYRGEIFGSENGEWSVRTNEGDFIPLRNVFQQAQKHRWAFLEKWKRLVSSHFSDIIGPEEISWVASWAYFQPGSRYADDKIPFQAVPWFNIVTRDTLTQKFQFIRNSYQLHPKDMELVMEDLRLTESPILGDLSNLPDETFTEYLQYAEIHFGEKNYTVAQLYITKCLNIDPGNKEAQQLSQRISWFLKN